MFLGPSTQSASSGMHLQVSYPGNLSLRGKLQYGLNVKAIQFHSSALLKYRIVLDTDVYTVIVISNHNSRFSFFFHDI